MKKFLTTTLFLATLLMLSLTGCTSDRSPEPPTLIDPDAEHTLLLRTVQSPTTRGVNRPVQDNEPLALLTGDLYLVHQTGIISHHFQIVAADAGVTYLTDANLAAGIIHRNLLNDVISLPGVPGTVTRVVMVGNYQGTLPTGSFVSAVGSRVLDIISQHDAQGNTVGVNLFGEDALTLRVDGAGLPILSDDGSPIFTASVFLRPTVARFEITDITAAGNITAFTIDGIFIDGFYRQMSIDGTLADNATPFLAGVTPASFTNTAYSFDTNFAVHDWREAVGGRNWTGSAATSLTVQAGGTSSWTCVATGTHTDVPNVWGYQVFAQSHAHARTIAPPSIVIRLSGITSACGSSFPDPQFVTIGSFIRRVEGVHVPLTEILASRIYRIPAGSLVFDEHDLSPHPNNLEIEVQIEVLLAVWNPEEVLPDAPLRQSNPQSVSIYEQDTHTFLLGAAWGGGCIDPVVYLWEQSADGINWEPAYGINNETDYTTGYLPHNTYFRRIASRCGYTITSAPALVTIIWIDGVIINGVRWADSNVSTTGTFVDNPEDAGLFFQWNTAAGIAPFGGGAAWTPGNSPCPAGWRLPTETEFLSLGTGIWTTDWNNTGVAGRIFGTPPFQIFLPAAGFRPDLDTNAIGVGTSGFYWTATPRGSTDAAHFLFTGSGSVIESREQSNWLTVRCVAVEHGAVEYVTLDMTEVVLFVGETQPLVATIEPDDAFNQNITWSSGNTSVATVNANGVVTAVSAGTTLITVTTVDGGHVAQALITIHPALATPHPAAASVNCNGNTHTFNVGVATGGYGTITYQWQSSANGTVWTDIAGATGQNLTTAALTANTHFRRVASNMGRSVASSGALVTVPAVLGTPNPTTANVTSGNTRTINLGVATGGSGTFTYQWQISGNGTTWTNIHGATGQNLTTAPLTANTHFRRRATCNTCGFVYSQGALTTVPAVTSPGATIAGVRWANRNVNTPGTFVANPQASGRQFQWGTIDGVTHHWPATGATVTGWNSNANRVAWTAYNNPCPSGWRLPTLAEIDALHANGSTWHTNWNGTGIAGRVFPAGATAAQVTAASPTAIFLPVNGWRHNNDGVLHSETTHTRNWSSTPSGTTNAHRSATHNNSLATGATSRALAYQIRCVQ